MPRPSKLTLERKARVLTALRAGLTRSAAAASVGVDRGTLARWMQRYPRFAADAELAEGEGRAALEAILSRSARAGGHKAAMMALRILERRYPEWRLTAQVEVEVTGQVEHRVEFIQPRFTAESAASTIGVLVEIGVLGPDLERQSLPERLATFDGLCEMLGVPPGLEREAVKGKLGITPNRWRRSGVVWDLFEPPALGPAPVLLLTGGDGGDAA